MHLLGFFLILMDLEQLQPLMWPEIGDTAVAELKSLDGLAAVVKRGEGQLMLVYITVHLYTPVYIGTLPSPTGFWRFLTEY